MTEPVSTIGKFVLLGIGVKAHLITQPWVASMDGFGKMHADIRTLKHNNTGIVPDVLSSLPSSLLNCILLSKDVATLRRYSTSVVSVRGSQHNTCTVYKGIQCHVVCDFP